MVFARVYVLAQHVDPSSTKNAGKKEQKLDFDYLFSESSRDYQNFHQGFLLSVFSGSSLMFVSAFMAKDAVDLISLVACRVMFRMDTNSLIAGTLIGAIMANVV